MTPTRQFSEQSRRSAVKRSARPGDTGRPLPRNVGRFAGKRTSTRHPDGAFTLIELLIAVTIIAILLTLSTVLVGNMLQKARERATYATITKIDNLLKERLRAFHRSIDDRNQASDAAGNLNYAQRLRRMDSLIQDAVSSSSVELNATQRERVYGPARGVPRTMVLKDMFRESFPQIAIDIPLAKLPDEWNPFMAGSYTPSSSEIMFFVLTELDVMGTAPVGEDQFDTNEVGDVDGNGRREFLDAWGNPLRFYMWPTRLIRPFGDPALPTDPSAPNLSIPQRKLAGLLIAGLPAGQVGANGVPGADNDAVFGPDDDKNGTNNDEAEFGARGSDDPDDLNIDPDDPTGHLGILSLIGVDLEAMYHTPNTYHTPLIVSAGADGILGLLEPTNYDADRNGDGVVNPGEDANGNGAHDGVYGHLAQPVGISSLADTQNDAILGPLFDNITNRNQRAGGN